MVCLYRIERSTILIHSTLQIRIHHASDMGRYCSWNGCVRVILWWACLFLLTGEYGTCHPRSPPSQSGCLMVYNEGAKAPELSVPPKCPSKEQHQKQSSSRGCRRVFKEDWKKFMLNCEVAQLKGRRTSQEDRTFCALDLTIPWLGLSDMEEKKVGLLAVFDGHNGAEASELAASLLPEYFLLHMLFLLEGLHSGDSSVGLRKISEELPEAGQLSTMGQRSMLLTRYKPCFEDASITENDVRGGHYGLHCLEVCKKEGKDQFSFEVFLKDRFIKILELRRSWWVSLGISEDSMYRTILKEALLRAIFDIDIAFTNEALRSDLQSGSTASIVLKADEYVLVANIGDSKALLCSECSNLPEQFRGASWREHKRKRNKTTKLFRQENSNNSHSLLCVKELTQDHRPDRDEERTRIEAAGGSVLKWRDVPRVNGELAISRAIGDVSFKKYGVISEPEVTDWQRLSSNDSYLVVASDGIFEKMNTQDICNLLLEAQRRNNHSTEHLPANVHALALAMVNAAFDRGSMDNLAAVVLALDSTAHSARSYSQRGSSLQRNSNFDIDREENVDDLGADVASYYQMTKKNKHKILANMPGMPIQGRWNSFNHYHLIENLDDYKGYVFLTPQKDIIKSYDGFQAFPEGVVPVHREWQLDLYHDQDLCLSFQLASEDERQQCLNPEGFASFFGLIRSIPFDTHQFNSTEVPVYEGSDFRYFLKRRFDHGSFGEVWLAVHLNYTHNGDRFNFSMHGSQGWEGTYTSINNMSGEFHNDQGNSTMSSLSDSHVGFSNDDTFILKRIMVERGYHAYLSGLREKHFGEIFLNASTSLRSSEWKSLSKLKQFFRLHIEDLDPFGEQVLDSVLEEENIEDEEGLKHIARYIESIETQAKEFWLVFQNEGQSLSKLIYTADDRHQNNEKEKSWTRENFQILQPSSWWHWLRQTEEGKEVMRSLIWQLLWATKACHDRNITHRDIKPENMVVCATKGASSNCLRGLSKKTWPYNLTMRVIDFGSAIDQFTLEHLYGVHGPSRGEQTLEYAPPEAILQNKWFLGSPQKPLKYDMWSIGVVMLELILGTPHVFQISARTHVLLDKHLEGWTEVAKELAYRLRALMELCILLPGSSPHNHQYQTMEGIPNQSEVWPASWECSEEAFAQRIRQQDPLKLGFPNIWALRLVRQLLQWHPEDRISATDALQHPYFMKVENEDLI